MRVIEENIDPAIVVAHLKSKGSAISLSFPAQAYTVVRLLMDAADVDRLILWGEFTADTDGSSRKVIDADVRAIEKRWFKRIANGDAANGLKPLDIRRDAGFELVLETNSRNFDFLNIIDGNHRALTHHLIYADFTDVPAFVCIHPEIRRWK